MIFATAYMKKAVSLHQLNQTDVEKRYHHLLLIQNILGKLSKKNELSSL